jgi:hypothetical protein
MVDNLYNETKRHKIIKENTDEINWTLQHDIILAQKRNGRYLRRTGHRPWAGIKMNHKISDVLFMKLLIFIYIVMRKNKS